MTMVAVTNMPSVEPVPASPTTDVVHAPTGSGSTQSSPVPVPDEMQAVIKRLNRAAGQIGGIVKMIDAGRDCQDIVTQLSAVSKAVDRAGFAVIALGLRQCIIDPSSQKVDVDAMEKLFLSLA